LGGQTVGLILFGGICIVGIRGGLQYIPIGIRNAVQVTNSAYTPIVVNTPFSIINTFTNDKLPDVHYLPDDVLRQYVEPVKEYPAARAFTPKNVVFVILESFSKEFTRLGGSNSYTPFLDSLMDISLTCTRAYANGLHSAEGVPAILSGVPSLMEESITTSVYGANRLTALPAVLRDKGYATSFFHGGTNGTMSFDVFCAAAGFDHYYGRTEYGQEQDYDDNWGIWDEPFLHYFGQQLNQMKTPFMAAVFTLSSHPPFTLPQPYAHRFPKGTLPIHACIGYSDYALRRFFADVRPMPWFANTLFVITADHCSPLSAHKSRQHNMGKYEIPVLFYAPGDTALRGYTDTLTQQIDILPSVLDYLGYDLPFFAYGNSIFRASRHPRYAINQESGRYQWLMNNYLLQTIEAQPLALYQLPEIGRAHV
jgi:phosphoglycerol transferase MdoB-like AlkP superfamily enzyme